MNLYGHTKFTGHYPVGTAAVVWADTPEEATDLLNAELKDIGLDGDADSADMFLIEPKVRVVILRNGDY